MRGTLKLTPEDREWANQVKDRDGRRCVICGSPERLNAHHIIVRENHETKFDVMNGLSLCPKHHFFCRQVSAHNNPIGLFMWLEKNRPNQFKHCKEEMEKILNDTQDVTHLVTQKDTQPTKKELKEQIEILKDDIYYRNLEE